MTALHTSIAVSLLLLLFHCLLCRSSVLAESEATHAIASHFDNSAGESGLQAARGAFKSQLEFLSHSSKSRSRGRGRMGSGQCEELSSNLCQACRASTRFSAIGGRCTTEQSCNRSFTACRKRARVQFNSLCYGVTTSRRPRGRKRKPGRQLKRRGKGGKGGKSKGRGKKYYPVRFSCGAPTNLRIAPQDECGSFTAFNFDYSIDMTTYCGTELDNTPGLQIEERSSMEEAIKNYFNRESECFEEDPCERIDYQAIAVNEFTPAEICSDTAALGENGRRLQRRKRSSRSKGRGSGRCRSREGRCSRKKKKRVLLMIDRDETGRYAVREESHENKNDADGFNLRARSPQTGAEDQSNGRRDLKPDRGLQQACAADVDLVSEMKATGYEGFQTIDEASVEEVIPADNCVQGRIECDVETTCCGRTKCRCDSASESYCAIGTEGLGACELYDDSGENLCCALNPFPPLAFLYSSCDCGPLPIPQCSKQAWVESARGGNRRGSFQVKAEMKIISICGDEFDVRRALKRVAFKYLQELIDFGGCENYIEVSQDGVEITNLQFSSSCDSASGGGSGVGDSECVDVTSGQQLGLTSAVLTVTGSYIDFIPIELPLESLDLRRKLFGRGEYDAKERRAKNSDCECTSYICILLREVLSGDLKKNIVRADAKTFGVESVKADPSRSCIPFGTVCGLGDICCEHPSLNSRLVCNTVPVGNNEKLCCIPEGQECGGGGSNLPALINGGCCDTACNEVGQKKLCCNDIASCSQFL